MYAYDSPLSSYPDMACFLSKTPNLAKEAPVVIEKSEKWMLKCALLALSPAVLATIYPV
jgi:hypothetical protein